MSSIVRKRWPHATFVGKEKNEPLDKGQADLVKFELVFCFKFRTRPRERPSYVLAMELPISIDSLIEETQICDLESKNHP